MGKKKAAAAAPVRAAVKEKPAGVAGWISAHARAAALALIALGTIRIVATYGVYNHTSDELVHEACGMQWLDRGEYKIEAQHPPLARVASALGPYLAGVRSQGKSWAYEEGALIFYSGGQYLRNLSLARMGILPFFWIACLVVFFWARRDLGDIGAVVALALFSFLPPVLAHAGLATTDMALTAFTGASFFSMLLWLERPTPARSALFGACVGLAVLSKFSALPFLPAAVAAALLWYFVAARPGLHAVMETLGSHALPFGLAVVAGAFVIWAGYRFDFANGVPAPALFAGIKEVMQHNAVGHSAYLLGSRGESGWRYFFPVILAVKTPLAFLALVAFGCMRKTVRRVPLPLAFALGILLFSMTSRINIGVRHVLPVYIGLSLVAGAGALRLLEIARSAARGKWTLGALAGWMALTSLLSHPDYLPYFNALAGDEPEKIAVDSDLDWGQDMNRLGRRLRELGAREVAFTPFVLAKLETVHGFPPVHKSDPVSPSPGWNAVSLTVWKESRLGLFNAHPEVKLWPDAAKPVERVGKGILLYYFPPAPR